MNITAIVCAVLGSNILVELVKGVFGINTRTKTAILLIEQNILMKDMEKYIEQGYITKWQRKNLDSLIKSYEKFGGDDFIHDMYELCRELPIK